MDSVHTMWLSSHNRASLSPDPVPHCTEFHCFCLPIKGSSEPTPGLCCCLTISKQSNTNSVYLCHDYKFLFKYRIKITNTQGQAKVNSPASCIETHTCVYWHHHFLCDIVLESQTEPHLQSGPLREMQHIMSFVFYSAGVSVSVITDTCCEQDRRTTLL